MRSSAGEVDGDIYDDEIQQKWLDTLFEVMSDEKLYFSEAKKAHLNAKTYTWENMAKEWEAHFE